MPPTTDLRPRRPRLRAYLSAFLLWIGATLGGGLAILTCLPPTIAPPSEASIDAATSDSTDDRRLARHDLWQITEAADDPWASERPSPVVCPPIDGYKSEDFNGEPSFQVHTFFCNYITAQQPTLRALYPGQILYVRLWHFAIYSPEGTHAHLALRLGSSTLFERTIPLPAKSQLLTTEWPVPSHVPQGTPLFFHLHNHGSNTWQLLDIRLR